MKQKEKAIPTESAHGMMGSIDWENLYSHREEVVSTGQIPLDAVIAKLQAMDLLLNTGLSYSDVAHQCGYSKCISMTLALEKEYGLSMTEIRKGHLRRRSVRYPFLKR